jgi:8-oxo-dGTP pyrophosphatase MutT (NUDIX family)
MVISLINGLFMKLLLVLLPLFLSAAIYQNKPEDFKPKFEIVGSFLEWDGKILILHRQDFKAQGNTWAIPGGKIEKDETPIQASIRETYEENRF